MDRTRGSRGVSDDMITADDLNADLCTVGGVTHDWRAHSWRQYPYASTRTSWRCVWCHVVACGDYSETDPCWKPYHHRTGHLSRSGVAWSLGANRP
jgi:hypothetical protein